MEKNTINTSGDYQNKQQQKLGRMDALERSQGEKRQERRRNTAVQSRSQSSQSERRKERIERIEQTSSFTGAVTSRRTGNSRSGERQVRTSSNVNTDHAGSYQIKTRKEKNDSRAYNPSRDYEEYQQIKHGYESKVRNNQNIRLNNTIQTEEKSRNGERGNRTPQSIYRKTSYPDTKTLPRNYIPQVRSGKDNLHLYEASKRYIQGQMQKSDDLGLNTMAAGITAAYVTGYSLKQYYKAVDSTMKASAKIARSSARVGRKIATGTYRNVSATVKQVKKYGVKGTINHRVKTIQHKVKTNHVVHTASLLVDKSTRKSGIQVIKSDGKFFVKGVGKTTVKLGKASLKTSVKSGSYIVKTATAQGLTAAAQGIDMLGNALESTGDFGNQTIALGIKAGKTGVEAAKIGAKSTRFMYRSIKTGVKVGVKTGKATISAARYVRKNGWKKAGEKVAEKAKNGAKNIVRGILNGIKTVISSIAKIASVGGVAFGILCIVALLTTPMMLFNLIFGGEAKDDNDVSWNIHDYVSEQSTKKIDDYAEEIVTLYNSLSTGGEYEIITLYNNMSGIEVEVSKDTIKSSIPSANDFTEIIEPVFNVLMITRYELTASEEEKKSTFDYLWNLLNNLYTQKLSPEYCTETPDSDGIYYAGDNCLRPSDVKYHTSDSGRDCCTTTYTCGGHPATIDGKQVTLYCNDAALASCNNKSASFSCSGYKECLGHRRCRIVMDFNGINALIAEEWGDRINELELKDSLTEDEKAELKTLISNRNFCLAFVEFLHLNDENYNTDYEIGGTGGNNLSPNITNDIDPDAYGLDESVGARIALAGLQKIGYNYVYGGLTWCNDPSKKGVSGIDCSGFTYLIIKEVTGNTIPRTSAAQSQSGVPVASLAQAKAGDLIFYGRNGVQGVGHVAIYIGNGQIVHASNPNDGVKVSNASYKTILAIRRYW